MRRITIDASLIRGAQKCQAKKDVRYYLNGIFLSKNGEISSTNGHVGFFAPHGQDLNAGILFCLDQQVPKSATVVKLNIYDDSNIVAECSKEHKVIKKICGNVVLIRDGDSYPDVRALEPKTKPVDVSRIYIRADYLSIAEKALEVNWALDVCIHGDRVVCKHEEKTVLVMLSRS